MFDTIRFHLVRFAFQIADQVIEHQNVIAAAVCGSLIAVVCVLRSNRNAIRIHEENE